MKMKKKEVKVAIEMEDKSTALMPIDSDKPLSDCIQRLCEVWDLPGSAEDYSLVFSDRLVYITEENRRDIKDGNFLRLTYCIKKEVTDILEALRSPNSSYEQKKEAAVKLMTLGKSLAFAEGFVACDGLNYIMEDVMQNISSGLILGHILQSFAQIIEHNIVPLDQLNPVFVAKIVYHVNANDGDSRTLEACLSILETVVLNSSSLARVVEEQITVPNLVKHIQNGTEENQQLTIALINALFHKAEPTKRKIIHATLSSRQIRQTILTSILQKHFRIGAEMRRQLSILQTVLFSSLDEQRKMKLDPNSSEAMEMIHELRKRAFHGESEHQGIMPPKKATVYSRDFKRLGFLNVMNPLEDLVDPPGALALHNMVYFAKNYNPTYTKIILSNSSRADAHECPFARCSIRLTRLLADILKIGESSADCEVTFIPMFFTRDDAFEEFFSVCIVLLDKTWKEMRATFEDLVKVFTVVRDQIIRSLRPVGQPVPSTFEKFQENLNKLPYQEIAKIWKQERCDRDESDTKAIPIVQLRNQVMPELLAIIAKHRLQCLIDGEVFQKYSNKGQRIKDGFWCCKLSPNTKVFHYGDCKEHSKPSIEELPHKLPVVEIKSLVTGRDCPHMKKGKLRATLAFSIIPEPEQEPLNFMAPNENVYNMWVDGISALLGEKMPSQTTSNDLDILLNLEIKVRLLDTEGVEIPDTVPPIPNSPPDYPM